jgi:hypothetical protein
MKATIRDEDAFSSVRPFELAAYLRATGWQEVQRVPKGSFWAKQTEHGSVELLLPMDSRVRDFRIRIADALAALEVAERRSQLEIIEDLSMASADIVRPRLRGASNDGSLTIEQGAYVHEHARALMLAAACAAVATKQVYARRKPELAMDYLSHARFGPPKRGSYILTIISPVRPRLNLGVDLLGDAVAPEEPFERRTVRVLAEALRSLSEASEVVAITNALDPMRAAVAQGVSANLCEAILGLNYSSGNAGLDFSFSWETSNGIPLQNNTTISISADAMPILDATAKAFRETGAIEDSEVIGVVQRLTHMGGDEGVATIVGTSDGEARTVQVSLGGDAHAMAVTAYQDRTPVKCVGDLVKQGRSWELRNPREFGAFADP